MCGRATTAGSCGESNLFRVCVHAGMECAHPPSPPQGLHVKAYRRLRFSVGVAMQHLLGVWVYVGVWCGPEFD